MIPLHWLRDHFQDMEWILKQRGISLDWCTFQKLDEEMRRLKKEIQEWRHKKNQWKKENLRSPKVAQQYHKVRRHLRKLEKEYRQKKKEWDFFYQRLPNRFLENSPLAPEATSKELFQTPGAGEAKAGKSYLALMRQNDWGGLEKGRKIASSLFPLFLKEAATYLRRLASFLVDFHITRHGYTEVQVPHLVNSDTAFSSGHLPRFENLMFSTEKKSLFLIPTAELPLLSLHRGEILSYKLLPLKYVALTPCFRREPGVKPDGLVRLRQFDKVELFQFTTPEDSERVFEEMIEEVKRVLFTLSLPFRLRKLHYRELPFSAAAAVDVEVWCPVSRRYLEVSTISHCLDFQARRAKIKFRKPEGSSEYVHTLNASGVALPRLWIALLENHQTEEGEFLPPPFLKKPSFESLC